MKTNIILSILVTFFTLISCKKEITPQQKDLVKIEPVQYSKFYGNWVGDFVADESTIKDEENDYIYSNKINIVIKNISNRIVLGQSIVAGNKRTLKGNCSKTKEAYEFILNEPGDQKNDGVFTFTIKNDTLSGYWIANDENAIVKRRNFKLTKKNFEYNPNLMLPPSDTYEDYVDWYSQKIDSTEVEIDSIKEVRYEELYRTASDVITKINSSTQLLKEADLKNLKKLELEILRNTIFARHGYTFKKKSFRQFFDPVEWYVPISDDVSSQLTVIEKQNIKLLSTFEKYAEENYDSFGR